jgi:nitrite reductase/ring-hydroxylating ferredoxin subunit
VTDWTEVAASLELMGGKPIRVSMNGETVLLIKADDQVFAIGNQCTHQGAGLDRGVLKMTCPAHGSMFNLESGKPMRPPATKPVPVYDVKVEDGRVFVRPRG